MKTIAISDMTIRQSASGNSFSLSFREKIEVAKMMDKVGANVIEAPGAGSGKTEVLLIKSLASAVKFSTLAVPVEAGNADNLNTVLSALSEAVSPRVQVRLPVSTVQMEYFRHIKAEKMVDLIKSSVSMCREKIADVEFVAEDAGRAEPEFLREAVLAAAEAGASVVTVCDTAGILLPDEFISWVSGVRAYLPENVKLGVECSNELYMADTCSVAALRGGADEIKAATYGDKFADMAKIVRMLKGRGADIGIACDVKTTELERTTANIKRICTGGAKRLSPFGEAGKNQDSDIVLTPHDELPAICRAVVDLGYELSDDDNAKVFEEFKKIAEKKGKVSARELDAIVASAAMQVPPTFRLESYVINSGNIISSTAHIRLNKGEAVKDGLAVGDGPVDAAFRAIEQIVGRHFELDDFQIQAVTEGKEAIGESVIRLRSGGKVYAGRGTSTDIVGAAVNAYINALNKIVYEEA
ncbi:MAG: hypothetical protein MJ067_03855 [Oscillospiraceae bacterium]|nr:hypothetical protein [Oscillospiraceae bacterium]